MSDVRSLRESIEETYLAAKRGLSGVAMVARHDFIQKKMEVIDGSFRELAQLAGELTASELIITTFELAEAKYALEQEKAALEQKKEVAR